MADKAISELLAANQVTPTDLFVLEQSGVAKKLTGHTLENWLLSLADGHGGIQSIVKHSTSGLKDTYRITFADTTTFDFVVTNGRNVNSVTKTGTSGLVDTYAIEYNDGTSDEFTVTNGAKGDKGDNAYTHIKFASQEPTEASHSFGDVPDKWIGFYWGNSSTAPTDWTQYKWYQFKGDKGDTGEPATLVSSEVRYQASDSGKIIPSGTWSSSVPVVAQGKYLWTRTTQNFNTGSPVASYSVSRMGLDGTGSVSAVANISPNADGNVPLTAENIGAVPSTGGDLTGELRMNGQPIKGLNAPTENDQAANMGFVNQQVRKAAPHNLLDNSDFLHFIAQAGISAKHDKDDVYAGDRWILDSGTVTGNANANGDGYSDIVLNGTIRQKVASIPSASVVGIEMVSGTAEIAYADGEVTITSQGGKIRGAMFFDGVEALPKYQPKGYGAELAECQRYYYETGRIRMFSIPTENNTTAINVFFPVKMRIVPTISYTQPDDEAVHFDFVTDTGATGYANAQVKSVSKFVANADL